MPLEHVLTVCLIPYSFIMIYFGFQEASDPKSFPIVVDFNLQACDWALLLARSFGYEVLFCVVNKEMTKSLEFAYAS